MINLQILKVYLNQIEVFYYQEKKTLQKSNKNITLQTFLTKMDKKWYQILENQNRSAGQHQDLVQLMGTKFFKSLITPLPIQQLIQKVELCTWPAQTVICKESQKIDSYYFLLQGSVNLYKKVQISEQESVLQIVKNINEPSIISDSFFSHSPHRSFTVIANDSSQQCRGFSILRSVVEELCSCLARQYKILKAYFCSFLNVSSDRFYKIDLYQTVQFKTFLYGQNVKFEDQILIIYSGECLMNFQEKVHKKKRRESPFKAQLNKQFLFRPLLKLCQNQCLGMQALYDQDRNKQRKFKYVVTNQKLVCISISFANLALFPNQLNEKIQMIHDLHMKKLDENFYFQNLNKDKVQPYEFLGSKSLSPIFKKSFSPKKMQSSEVQKTPQILNNFSRVRPKFIQIPVQNTQVSIQKKRKFKLPNIKFHQKQELQQIQRLRLNKTQSFSNQKSPLKNSSLRQNEINDLRKKFCIGFDLKNKCSRQSLHLGNQVKLKETIREPKGYFPFAKNKKHLKQNLSMLNENPKRSQSPSNHKEWSCYVKLPKIL